LLTTYLAKKDSSNFEIKKENAIADYTGQEFASTGTATATVAAVRLTATIRDTTAVDAIGDPASGRITKANARFKLRGINPTNMAEVVAPFMTRSLPVTLLTSDTTIGSVLLDTTLSTGNYDAVVYEVSVVIDSFYTGKTSVLGTITVSKTLDDFITFGGHIDMLLNPTVNTSSGFYPSDLNSKVNFGGSGKYNKNKSNLQGGANIIWRSGGFSYQAKGIIGGSNGSLSVNASDPNNKRATMIAKANIAYAETGLAVPNTNNSTMTINMRDRGEPGVNDSLSIEIRNGSGQLVYSTNWISINTIERKLSGGNIQVRSTTAVVSQVTAVAPGGMRSTAETEQMPLTSKPFAIKAYPNPSERFFTLNVDGDYNKDVEIKVFNLSGKQVYVTKGSANRTYRFGDGFINGVYLVEVIQGDKRKTIKLIKQQ